VSGRVIAVTGASQGMGFETALAFARAGDTVIATSRSREAATARFSPYDLGIVGHELDITEQGSVDRFTTAVIDRFGRLDVLVNNAGRGFRGTTEQLAVADIMDSLEVNFLGAVRMTKAFLPLMRSAGSGRLIAISSIGGAMGQPFRDAYCAAKFALEGLYESLHPVAAMCGVRVSIIEPGPVVSEHDARALHLDAGEDAELAAIESCSLAVAATARGQSAADAASHVLACADDPDPALRYQTSKLATYMVGRKLADLSGEAVTSMTTSWLEPPAVETHA
jgi:NAD(P)-dependent dehydrogenase (short-subunit alcohol dehydrogenase family)